MIRRHRPSSGVASPASGGQGSAAGHDRPVHGDTGVLLGEHMRFVDRARRSAADCWAGGDEGAAGAAVVALPVLDLLGHLLRGEAPLVAITVDDELVQVLAVVLFLMRSVARAAGSGLCRRRRSRSPGHGGQAACFTRFTIQPCLQPQRQHFHHHRARRRVQAPAAPCRPPVGPTPVTPPQPGRPGPGFEPLGGLQPHGLPLHPDVVPQGSRPVTTARTSLIQPEQGRRDAMCTEGKAPHLEAVNSFSHNRPEHGTLTMRERRHEGTGFISLSAADLASCP